MENKSHPITIYCSGELYRWVQQYAAQDDRSMSGWVVRKLELARAKAQALAPVETKASA
jgi:hypothetical protein